MTQRYFILFATIMTGNFLFSQVSSTIYFQYDDAGNQIFRGDGMLYKNAGAEELNVSQNTTPNPSSSAILIDEKEFWKNIKVYPVPVKDILYIDWNDKADDLISEIGLYEQSTLHWVFQNKEIPSLDKKIKIDMTRQYMGVFILTFSLKNGQRMSKNITKF